MKDVKNTQKEISVKKIIKMLKAGEIQFIKESRPDKTSSITATKIFLTLSQGVSLGEFSAFLKKTRTGKEVLVVFDGKQRILSLAKMFYSKFAKIDTGSVKNLSSIIKGYTYQQLSGILSGEFKTQPEKAKEIKKCFSLYLLRNIINRKLMFTIYSDETGKPFSFKTTPDFAKQQFILKNNLSCIEKVHAEYCRCGLWSQIEKLAKKVKKAGLSNPNSIVSFQEETIALKIMALTMKDNLSIAGVKNFSELPRAVCNICNKMTKSEVSLIISKSVEIIKNTNFNNFRDENSKVDDFSAFAYIAAVSIYGDPIATRSVERFDEGMTEISLALKKKTLDKSMFASYIKAAKFFN